MRQALPFDLDGDGRDEILIGYSLWDHTGKQLWSRDGELKDHADGLMMGNLSGDPKAEPRAYFSGSDEGFIVFDKRGQIIRHVRIGHAQSPSVAKYRPDLPGLQYMTINFWKNPGVVIKITHARCGVTPPKVTTVAAQWNAVGQTVVIQGRLEDLGKAATVEAGFQYRLK